MLTVLILTPLPVEFEAVIEHVPGKREVVFAQQTVYEIGQFKGQNHDYQVVVCEPGMKNIDMALATERAIVKFQPQLVLLVGIAAGIKDLNLGDVIVAEKVYDYESGKEDVDGYKSRPETGRFSAQLLARAKYLRRGQDWKKRVLGDASKVKVESGAIATGNKVLASIDNLTIQRIKKHLNDAKAVEMEAIGFAIAIQSLSNVHGLVVRGISDLCEGKEKTDKENWQSVAASHAAAFAFELLWSLDASDFIDIKKNVTLSVSPQAIRPLQPSQRKLGEQIRKAIYSGELEAAMEMLIECTPDAYLLKAQYENAKKSRGLGLVSQEYWDICCNNIAMTVLDRVKAIP